MSDDNTWSQDRDQEENLDEIHRLVQSPSFNVILLQNGLQNCGLEWGCS